MNFFFASISTLTYFIKLAYILLYLNFKLSSKPTFLGILGYYNSFYKY